LQGLAASAETSPSLPRTPPCAAVDRFGRRPLFIEGGVQMIVGLFATGGILAVEFKSHTAADLPTNVAIGLLVVIWWVGVGWVERCTLPRLLL
jgi:hypothetical protein